MLGVGGSAQAAWLSHKAGREMSVSYTSFNSSIPLLLESQLVFTDSCSIA